MQITVKKWGNSAAVRIPAAVMAAARLHPDDTVRVREHKGRIIIEPIRERKVDLKGLVEAITLANLHQPCDFGGPKGQEIW